MKVIEAQQGFLTRGDLAPDIAGELQRHAVLGLLVAEASEQDVVVTTAEHDELFALISSEDLELHEQAALSVDFTPMAHGEDRKLVLSLVENDAVITVSHPYGGGARHALHVALPFGPISIKRRDQSFVNRLGQLREGSRGRSRKDEGLSHISIIIDGMHPCNGRLR
jgi:hypothetical protein